MITVVVSSYRYGHLAAHCIESILSQSKKPSRIIFVDDGVGDCEHLPKLYPEVEYIMRETNLGVVENFDDVLKQVNSEYVMFLGADNWLRSDAIELLSTAKSDIVTYDIMVTGELKEEMLDRHEDQLKKVNGDLYWNRKLFHHGSMLYRTKLGQSIGYRKRKEDSSYTEEDWNLWNKMVDNGASVSYIPKPLLYYRRHRENFLKYDK
jgi:glycosyltransferase involved in cell wall biosynthesis